MPTTVEAVPQLLELLYEGVLCPERWNDFLTVLCREVGCEMAFVASHDLENQTPVLSCSLGISQEVVREWNSYYGKRNPVTHPFLRTALRVGYLLSAASFCDVPAAVQDSEYGHWVLGHEIYHSVIAAVPSGQDAFGSLNLIRPRSATPFGPEAVEIVRRLIPHLQRAFQIHRKLETLRAFSEAGKLALDRLDTAFVAVDVTGRVVLMNECAEAILKRADGIAVRAGRLAATNSTQLSRLDRLIRAAAMTGAGCGDCSGGAIAVERDNAAPPLSITVTPFRSSQVLTGEQPWALVFISDPAAKPAPRAAYLSGLFGLTPAECRLAESLLEGIDLRAAAERIRVTVSTARFMLKSVFQKTGCHRQALLVRLLSSLPGDLSRHQ